VPVLVGGSGLYLRAALDELRFPGTDPALRAGSRPSSERGRRPGPARPAWPRSTRRPPRMERRTAGGIVRALEVVTLHGPMPGQ
jgi:tRNA dimethylallyltransferase